LNLLTNAIRYSPAHSTVTIAVGQAGPKAWIAVSDEGEGLSPEQAARVFDKFERLGRTGDGGSGLGLYISRRLARAMGGDLVVSGRSRPEAPGQG
ncbi:sensor histidine kinase, partial [Salmonella enterica]|uniref:sensor histidine kinase n=1 Tax=Salmonella enterica TaxID=28901 RepID=UPI003D28B024